MQIKHDPYMADTQNTDKYLVLTSETLCIYSQKRSVSHGGTKCILYRNEVYPILKQSVSYAETVC